MLKNIPFCCRGGRSMKSKQEGFLALEAVVALAIVCIALMAMVTCLSGLKKLEQESSQRANQALAYEFSTGINQCIFEQHSHKSTFLSFAILYIIARIKSTEKIDFFSLQNKKYTL